MYDMGSSWEPTKIANAVSTQMSRFDHRDAGLPDDDVGARLECGLDGGDMDATRGVYRFFYGAGQLCWRGDLPGQCNEMSVGHLPGCGCQKQRNRAGVGNWLLTHTKCGSRIVRIYAREEREGRYQFVPVGWWCKECGISQM